MSRSLSEAYHATSRHAASTAIILISLSMTSIAVSSQANADVVALPMKAEDLATNERMTMPKHAGGIQAEGKDIGVVRHTGNDTWSNLKSGRSGTENTDFLVYGKPFYAMKAGTVVGCWRNAPNNPRPGKIHSSLEQRKIAGGGNHLWIQHKDGSYALYAHAIAGSIPARLCGSNTAATFPKPKSSSGSPDIHPNVALPKSEQVNVKIGTYLGDFGNTGSSSAPHLHVHLEKNGKPVPMQFEQGHYILTNNGKAKLTGPWREIDGKTLPTSSMAYVWPPRSVGSSLTWNNIPEDQYSMYFNHYAASGYMLRTTACRANGSQVLYDTSWEPTRGAWVGYFGLTTANYDRIKSNHERTGFREIHRITCATNRGHITTFTMRK